VTARAVRLASRSPASADPPAPAPHTTLVIGYGNSLRSDDGVGPALARAVARWRRPDIRTLAVHQLTPELADDLAGVDRAVFVDARVGDHAGGVQVVSLPAEGVGDSQSTLGDGHRGDPRALLALAELAYGHRPRAWWLTVPAVSLDFGEGLSPTTEALMTNALDAIAALIGIRSLRRA
jgi:hydrogenase maturation protease